MTRLWRQATQNSSGPPARTIQLQTFKPLFLQNLYGIPGAARAALSGSRAVIAPQSGR